MAASQLPVIRILKGLYLHNDKVLEAQMFSGLYWEYICYITLHVPLLMRIAWTSKLYSGTVSKKIGS